MLIDVTEKCSKETYELGDALDKFIGTVQEALSDGWQPGEDIPALVGGAVQHLAIGIQGMEEIPKEPSESLPGFIAAVDHSVRKIIMRFFVK